MLQLGHLACQKSTSPSLQADILGMEKVMLNTLQFRLTLPTAYHFLGRYLKAAGSQGDRWAGPGAVVDCGVVVWHGVVWCGVAWCGLGSF